MTSSINLFIAQLDKRIDDQLLKQEFERFGNVLSAVVAKDEMGASKGFGFVHFAFMSDGMEAMTEMDGRAILSRHISVQIANSQKDGNCYAGGTKATYWASEEELERRLQRFSLNEPDDSNDGASQTSDTAVDEASRTSGVKQRMLKLFKEQLFTDVMFYAENDHNMTISGHKAILAAGSQYFTDMLFFSKGAKEFVGVKMEVQISNDVSFDAFKNIVRYLYTDEVFFENDALSLAILDGAKEFKIYPLVQLCESHFDNQELTELNVCSRLQMSTSNKIKVLKNRCIEYIQKNTQKVIHSTDFLRCNARTICTICKLQSLNLREEIDLLHAVMRWLNNHNAFGKEQIMEELIKCFRFLTFTVSEFGDVMRRYPGLVTKDDGLKIMLYLSNPSQTPDFKSLPPWTNKNCVKRCGITQMSYEHLSPGNGSSVRRVVIPLRSADDRSITQNITEITSLLQMKCVKGFHQIEAIKLAFQAPVSLRSVIELVTINVYVAPRFHFSEHVEIRSSLEVTVTFSKVIKARPGDIVNFEVEAKNINFYRFLQFDDTSCLPINQHFEWYISSKPKEGKLYFIKEVQYTNQKNARSQSKPNLNRHPNKK